MTDQDKEVRITITVPASLRRLLKVNAAKHDRSFSGEIVHCLKRGSNWEEAAGGEFGDHAPAAESKNATL